MLTTTNGLVLSERTVKENDKFVTLLSPDLGVFDVMVRGAKKLNSTSASSTQLFCYASFCIEQKNGRSYLDSCRPINIFYSIRTDLAKLSLASYLAEIIRFTVTEGQSARDVMRLMLNCLHFLTTDERSVEQVKSVFELRLMSEIGMLPDLLCCKSCCAYDAERMYFYPESGIFVCADCDRSGFEGTAIPMSRATLAAMRQVVLSDFDKIFSFRINGASMKQLSRISEEFLLSQLGRSFKTLDFYKSVT